MSQAASGGPVLEDRVQGGAGHARPVGRSRSRTRMVYFSVASIWGFLVGTGAILSGLALGGRRLDTGPVVLALLAIALIAAIVGGCVAAMAYRQSMSRF